VRGSCVYAMRLGNGKLSHRPGLIHSYSWTYQLVLALDLEPFGLCPSDKSKFYTPCTFHHVCWTAVDLVRCTSIKPLFST
jgi:hypothetical protein